MTTPDNPGDKPHDPFVKQPPADASPSYGTVPVSAWYATTPRL